MQNRLRSTAHIVVVAVATAAGLWGLGFVPTVAAAKSADLAAILAVVAAVGLCAELDPMRSAGHDTMPGAFVGELVALLLFGPAAMTLVALVGVLASAIISAPGKNSIRDAGLDLLGVVLACSAGGVAYAIFGGSMPPFAWPWQAAPISAAVLAYCAVTWAAEDFASRLVKGTVAGPWSPAAALGRLPSHFIGAAVAVVLVEIVARQAWGFLPALALPMCFGWLAFRRHAERRRRMCRRRDALDSSADGVCLLDEDGRLISWNQALERLLECPRDRAIGRPIEQAVPILARSDLPRVIDETLLGRSPQTLSHVGFQSDTSTRVLNVTAIPEAEGVMLLWRDVTEQADAERTARQAAERFALVAEGAADGLWELRRRTHTLYVSARWRSIVGLAPGDAVIQLDDWFNRVHPDDLAGLKEALEAHMTGATDHLEHEHRISHEGGLFRRVMCCGVAERGAGGRTIRIAGSLTDITETATVRERVLSAGLRDPLTGLCNRSAFVDALGQRLNEYKQHLGSRFAVLYLDLDRFKIVNDSLGHLVGDELLVAVSRRLEGCVRPEDAIARLGGDEFAILLQRLDDGMQANVVAFRIQEALTAPFAIGGREVVTSASIGIAFSRLEYSNPEEVMHDADTAMYHAKTHGKARHELFDADMHARALDRLGLESDLRHAVKSSGFEMYYQPIVSLRTWMCTGFEALVRWQRNGKPVSPADFVPMAEELGLIEPLGTWVLQQACRTFAEWQRQFPACGLDCITVNVSTRQLSQQGFMYLVEQTVRQAGLKPANLRLEITETALMDTPQLAAQVLTELREFGVKIYLDDFGTGYSSLSHLHRLPVDALKIDRSFVRGLLLDDRPAMVESILALARTLQTGVVAEGVEDERQAHELERLGCVQAQGFFFSPPLPMRLAEQVLAARQPLGKRAKHTSGPTPVRPEPAARALAATRP